MLMQTNLHAHLHYPIHAGKYIHMNKVAGKMLHIVITCSITDAHLHAWCSSTHAATDYQHYGQLSNFSTFDIGILN